MNDDHLAYGKEHVCLSWRCRLASHVRVKENSIERDINSLGCGSGSDSD